MLLIALYKVYNPQLWHLGFEVRKNLFSECFSEKHFSLQGIAYPPKRKMSLIKDLIEMTRDVNHDHVNIPIASSFAEPMLCSPPHQSSGLPDKLLFFLITVLIPSVRTLWIVLQTPCNYTSLCALKLLRLFHHCTFLTGERNPRYKTSVGNWQHGYWRTNDTILNFKMKEGSWGQNSLASTFKGQQATVCRLRWFFKWFVNTSCV